MVSAAIPSTLASIAIILGTRGGLSDVGKIAAVLAAKEMQQENIRLVAIGGEHDDLCDVDVTYEGGAQELRKELSALPITRINLDEHGSGQQLKAQLQGISTVVAAVGNRQPFMARTIARDTQATINAMEDKQRLVVLGSFGVGEDFLVPNFITRLWSVMLSTILRGARTDLMQQESIVTQSSLDYLLVKPTGVAPEESPVNSWKILTKESNGIELQPRMSLSKTDAAKFMLNEAMHPTLHRTAIILGGDPTKPPPSKN